jgi:hypothetical protein
VAAQTKHFILLYIGPNQTLHLVIGVGSNQTNCTHYNMATSRFAYIVMLVYASTPHFPLFLLLFTNPYNGQSYFFH